MLIALVVAICTIADIFVACLPEVLKPRRVFLFMRVPVALCCGMHILGVSLAACLYASIQSEETNTQWDVARTFLLLFIGISVFLLPICLSIGGRLKKEEKKMKKLRNKSGWATKRKRNHEIIQSSAYNL